MVAKNLPLDVLLISSTPLSINDKISCINVYYQLLDKIINSKKHKTNGLLSY